MIHRLDNAFYPGKRMAKFRCGAFEDDLMAAMSKLSRKDVWITVRTHEGATTRVDEKAMIGALNSAPRYQVR
jgi:hypothetical protein